MAITDPLILPPDVVLVPVADLPEEVRRKFEHDEGDWAITRPRSRTPSRIVDARSAELLQEFRAPRTIAEAVIRYSRAREADPEATLEEAYPLLDRLLRSGFLVAEGTDEAEGIRTSLEPGERIAGWEVLELVHGLEDTELYQARGEAGFAALKIERPSSAGQRADLFAREAAVLERLAGAAGAPRLLAAGEHEGRRFLVLEWCRGVDAVTAAWDLRRRGSQGRPALLALARAIAAAYADLHERGVIHADVHSHNVLVSASGEVRLLDFGLSRWPGASADPGRGGVAFFFEPEYAAASRAGAVPPPASAAGEQYALAALLYLMIAGAHYRDFSLDQDQMLRQIAEEPPLPFAERGAEPWPEIEAVLARALAKTPEERFPSVAALAEALTPFPSPGGRGAPPPDPSALSFPLSLRERGPGGEGLLARFLERAGMDGPLFAAGLPEPPRVSVNYGAAGVACALYRIALAREDASLLSLADVWAERAAAALSAEDAFYNPAIQITVETVGRSSAWHTAAGVHAVRALIAHAMGAPGVQGLAVDAFRAALREPCESPDLTLGRSGLLLAGSLLLDTLGVQAQEQIHAERRRALIGEGEERLRALWAELDALPPVSEAEPGFGMAHGWAGFLYAALRWCRSAGTPLPDRVGERLAELAACARPWGRGVRWKWYEGGGESVSMPGWCNGGAGFVHLWSLAGEPDLAESAAWNVWEAPDGHGNLCCGLTGRAYALLHLWRRGHGPEWLDRARDLAGRAARAVTQSRETPDSLYKGEAGAAVLAADLARPEGAVMPFFEEEGW
ncbi:MAG TPA: lanthionine synthetase LanC family protein [Thermoanaerobaculia bacterium]